MLAAETTILHLSDTHILATEPERLHGQDTMASLLRLVEHVAAHDIRLDGIIITGDLANDGDLAAYRRLREAIGTIEQRLGAAVSVVMGNHDRRDTMRQGLLGEASSDAPFCYVQMLGDLRLIVLDSSVPGESYGQIGTSQRAWLSEQLRQPAPRGTLLALHHPPFRGTVPLLNTIMLRDREALAEVLRGSDVRAILAGHVHYPSAAAVVGIPCFTAPAIAYQIDPLDQAGYLGFAG